MFTLDYRSRKPLYDQLCQSIERMAACGVLEPGSRLPSVRMLAEELAINPNTVQKAYGLLERDGVICSLPGKGSFLTGEQNAVDKQREEAVQKVRVSAREALDCGVALGELLSAVQAEDSRRNESEKHD